MFGYVVGLPAFLLYFGIGLVMLVAFATIYAYATPHKELELIKQGNSAAVVAYLGAIFGFSIPLASAAANSIAVVDFIVWTIVGGVVQTIAFFLASNTMDNLSKKITDGNMTAGLWAGGIALAIGLLNAACMTY
ncbi:MAG: DUF350 domain-containing protein [Hyphomicrobiaceae bacterium]|nr:DUF350 domain-containing protein [Hyphomicrobiaceae bacterium]